MAVAIAAMPSPRPVRPRPSVVVALTLTGAPTAADSAASGGLGEQGGPAGAGPLRLRGPEVRAEIAQAGSAQQRVAGGVGGHVGIGMPFESLRFAGPVQAGEMELHTRHEPVYVDADAGSIHVRTSLHGNDHA